MASMLLHQRRMLLAPLKDVTCMGMWLEAHNMQGPLVQGCQVTAKGTPHLWTHTQGQPTARARVWMQRRTVACCGTTTAHGWCRG